MKTQTTRAGSPSRAARPTNSRGRGSSAWHPFVEDWPEQAVDACAPEGGIPAWVRMAQSSVAEQWAYALEASS